MPRTVLVVGLYREPDPARAAELAECLRRNCENPWIAEVHALAEEPSAPDVAHPKLRRVPHGRRLTFRDAFRYAGERLGGRPVILANTDIHFDRSLARLDGYDLRGRLLCLSRWDDQPDGTCVHFDFAHSQDAWIFEAPLRDFRCDWPLGIPGCDNRLTWEAHAAGLEVLNPSRSVRARHLHLSGVRHYTERQRLPGPVRPVPATWLGTPWLWIVTAGGGSSAETRRSAAAADADATLCFLEPGADVPPGAADALLAAARPGAFGTPDGARAGAALVVSRALYDRAGGLDELVAAPGQDVADLARVLRALGYEERRFPAALLPGGAAPQADEAARWIDEAYSRAKCAVLAEARRPLSLSARREIRRAVERRWLVERGLVPEAPCAEVTFEERMGYAVRRLQPGASSHVNDARPFVAVPPALLGKPFTQVVASRVSPVEVRFRTPGKLYVLVGTDWHGYYPATEFLRDRGFREPVPDLLTRRGTAFEVWSLLGEAGETVVLPTQVMLVAGELGRP